MKYTCRHPHTGEYVELTNKEWRCVKIGIPATSSLWQLLDAEHEYAILLTAVTEYPFDKLTLQWLVDMLHAWPTVVTCTPEVLLRWYTYMADYNDIPSYAANLEYAEELRKKMEKLQASKNKMLKSVARSLQRELKTYKKLQAIKAKRKLKRKRGR